MSGTIRDWGRTNQGNAAQDCEQTDAVNDAHISVDSFVSHERSYPQGDNMNDLHDDEDNIAEVERNKT